MKWIAPMEPINCNDVKTGSEYVHEIKWDGIRGLSYIEGSSLKLYTKKGNERTEFYPELKFLQEIFSGQSLILDGEMVVFDQNGRPSFHHSLVRETVKSQKNLLYYTRTYPVKYMVFDILQLGDKLLTKVPLMERTQLLKQLFDDCDSNAFPVFLSEQYADGVTLFDKMKHNNMEGIVSKLRDSFYQEGKKHEDWFKTKFTKKILCVVGGIQWKDNKPNSLLLGVKTTESEKLTFVGKASLGLKEADLQLLKKYRDELVQTEITFKESTLADIDKTGTTLTWTRPLLTCWISFLEMTADGHLRHPKITGFAALPAEEADGKVLTDE